MPITILSATGTDAQQAMFCAEDQLREQIRGSEQLYAAVAAAASRGKHRSIADASHVTLPFIRPDAVANAVSEMPQR